MPEVTAEEWGAKFEEVVGDLGVAIGAIVHDASDVEAIRGSWQKLGRGLSVLIEMVPPA
jgi:hypothetical protein